MRHYSAGFLGTITNECLEYVCSELYDCKVLIVPFTGSGKNIAAFTRDDRVIYSWDTQEATRLLVDALRMPPDVQITTPHGRDGYARTNYPIEGMDEGTARLINYIAQKGGVHDRAALVKTIIRATLMGRLSTWGASNEGYEHFWNKFVSTREQLLEWAYRPGIIVHTKGDYYASSPPEECDGLFLDPPKIIGNTDVYSGKAFARLNGILEQKEPVQPKWGIEGYIQKLETVLKSSKWNRAVVIYASGLSPTYKEVKESKHFGHNIRAVRGFSHGDRLDFVITLNP